MTEPGYGGPRPLDEQAVLEEWRLAHDIRRPLTDLEITLALSERLPEALQRRHNRPRQ